MLPNKDTLHEVIGKTIRSLVFRSGRDVHPEAQLFLVIKNGTYFELYGQEINSGRSLSEGNTARASAYARKFGSEVLVIRHE
jgi:hypothetical protein